MTFEDYKEHFETFCKIDTPEKLVICIDQYEKHLLHIEDEKYFEPFDQPLKNNLSNEYNKNLHRIFLFDDIKDNQFYCLIKPSFTPENVLIIEQQKENYNLIHVVLANHYWAVFSAGNSTSDIEKFTTTFELNKAVGDKLFALLYKTIVEAKHPKAKFIVLDGVVYSISKMIDGQLKTVSKHSPSETSTSGQIIDIIEQLIDKHGNLNDAILTDLEKKIVSLQ